MKHQVFITLITFIFVTAGCTGSHFSATLKDSSNSKAATAAAQEEALAGVPSQNKSSSTSITVGGALVREDGSKSKLHSQLKDETKSGLVSYKIPTDVTHLDKIETRSDYVQYGCDQTIPEFKIYTKDLTEAKPISDGSATLTLQAKVIILCGRVTIPEAFVTIVADQLILSGALLEPSNSAGIGFLSVLVNKVTLHGSSQITTRRANTSGLVLEGPSVSLVAQRAVDGSGSLSLRAIGEALVAEGKK